MSSRIKSNNFRIDGKVQGPFSSNMDSNQYSSLMKSRVKKIVGMRGTASFMKKDSPKLDVQRKGRKTRLTINRINQKVMHDVLATQEMPEAKKHLSSVNHVCDSCGTNINYEISRVLILSNMDGGPRLVFTHFFAPCWNFEKLLKKHRNCCIEKISFSFPENMSICDESIRKIQTSFHFWI
jgi:hypothetical protein